MFKKLFFVLVIILSSPEAFAKKNIWRDCGIGALVFANTPWAAVTSNITWDLGLTGSTTTTSSEDQCAGKSASAAHFIYQNYAIIEEQTATGSGDHLISMLNILDCSSKNHQNIINYLRSDFSKTLEDKQFSQKQRIEKAESYYDSVMKIIDSNFSKFCKVS